MVLGIKPITSRPHHPQTCGKNERGHQTLQKWLAARPAAVTLVELQALLDRYQGEFNNRPHQGLDPNQTPLERRIAAARHTPIQLRPEQPTLVRHGTVKPRGFVNWDGIRIAVGRELAGRMLLIFATGDHLLMFYRHHLVRELVLDRSRSYQRLLEPRRRDYNRDQLQLELQSHPQPAAPRGVWAGPMLPPRRCPGVPQRLPCQGRPQAVVHRSHQRPLRREERRPYTQRGAYQPPTNCHRCLDRNCYVS
jgi:hypothetical protein